MKILHKQFDTTWSWTEIAKGLFEFLDHDVEIEPSHKRTDCDRYDVILTQQPFMMKNIDDRKKVVTRIGTNSLFEQGRYNMNEIGRYMKECFAVIATNRYLYNEAKKYNNNVVFIPNGLDLQEWAVMPKKKGKFTVGFVGNINNPAYRKYKGFDLLEKACKEMNIHLKTALYGEKQIPHERMRADFYSKVSCIVHPTEGEGCSNTIMETLACGIPVITTKTAGFHGEMLEQGKNVLFCERTVESIKECIGWLRKDQKLYKRLKKEGRKFAEENHDIQQVAKEYDKVIRACYEANKNRITEQNPDQGVKVKVQALKSVYLDKIGKKVRGEVFEMRKDQALKLQGFVNILDVKEVSGPAADKMMRAPVKSKGVV